MIGAESAENCTHINTDQVFLTLWLTKLFLPSWDSCYRAARQLSWSSGMNMVPPQVAKNRCAADTDASSRVHQGKSNRARTKGSQSSLPQSQCPFSLLWQTEIGLKAHSPSGLISLPSCNVLFPPQHQNICFILGFESSQPLVKDKGTQQLTIVYCFLFLLSIAIKLWGAKPSQGNKSKQVKHPHHRSLTQKNSRTTPSWNHLPPPPLLAFFHQVLLMSLPEIGW